MIDKIIKKAEQLEEILINTRRYLHQNPELSCQEHNTAKFIHTKLIEAGIESKILQTEAGPAVIGLINAGTDKKTVAFRADMDALPLCEGKGKDYCSKNSGVMHACGHDFNMTSVLGTAFVLAAVREELDINAKFIFQPSEEKCNGALALVKQNVMDNVNAIFSVHADPSIYVGKIGIGSGVMASATDFFKIVVKGRGGHSARPHESVDAVFVANNIISYLYSGLLRNFDPLEPLVISVGEIHAGSAPNIIAEICEIKGTARTFNRQIRKNMQDLINKKSAEIAGIYGAEVEIGWEFGALPVVNNEILAKLAYETAVNIQGEENIIKLVKPSTGADDFSRYLEFSPGMLIRIGTGGENCCYPLHSCLFDIDEKSIIMAVKLLSAICINCKNESPVFSEYAGLIKNEN